MAAINPREAATCIPLPNELFPEFLQYLESPEDIQSVTLVCRRWREAAMPIWRCEISKKIEWFVLQMLGRSDEAVNECIFELKKCQNLNEMKSIIRRVRKILVKQMHLTFKFLCPKWLMIANEEVKRYVNLVSIPYEKMIPFINYSSSRELEKGARNNLHLLQENIGRHLMILQKSQTIPVSLSAMKNLLDIGDIESVFECLSNSNSENQIIMFALLRYNKEVQFKSQDLQNKYINLRTVLQALDQRYLQLDMSLDSFLERINLYKEYLLAGDERSSKIVGSQLVVMTRKIPNFDKWIEPLATILQKYQCPNHKILARLFKHAMDSEQRNSEIQNIECNYHVLKEENKGLEKDIAALLEIAKITDVNERLSVFAAALDGELSKFNGLIESILTKIASSKKRNPIGSNIASLDIIRQLILNIFCLDRSYINDLYPVDRLPSSVLKALLK